MRNLKQWRTIIILIGLAKIKKSNNSKWEWDCENIAGGTILVVGQLLWRTIWYYQLKLETQDSGHLGISVG